MVAMSDIQAVAGRIAREFRPERIILFGSFAYGRPGPDSDVDLLVLLPFDGTGFWKNLEILNRVEAPFALDLLARRPDETRRRYVRPARSTDPRRD